MWRIVWRIKTQNLNQTQLPLQAANFEIEFFFLAPSLNDTAFSFSPFPSNIIPECSFISVTLRNDKRLVICLLLSLGDANEIPDSVCSSERNACDA